MIRTEDLSKFYNGFKAVQGLNLHVRAGEIYGFLGPNGAGKTTTLSMLLGITRPTHGTVWLFDKQLRDDYFAIKRRIGVVSERQFLYDDVSGQEYLEFFAALYRVPEAARLLIEATTGLPAFFNSSISRRRALISARNEGRSIESQSSRAARRKSAGSGITPPSPRIGSRKIAQVFGSNDFWSASTLADSIIATSGSNGRKGAWYFSWKVRLSEPKVLP